MSSKNGTKDLEITEVQMGQVAWQRWEWSDSQYLIFNLLQTQVIYLTLQKPHGTQKKVTEGRKKKGTDHFTRISADNVDVVNWNRKKKNRILIEIGPGLIHLLKHRMSYSTITDVGT